MEQARAWLADKSGRRALKKEILANLLVNLQLEAKAGQEAGEVRSPQHTRQSRKQYNETAGMVLEILADEDLKEEAGV